MYTIKYVIIVGKNVVLNFLVCFTLFTINVKWKYGKLGSFMSYLLKEVDIDEEYLFHYYALHSITKAVSGLENFD